MKNIELEALITQPSRSLTRVLLDMAPVAASIAVDGRVVYANTACAHLWAFEFPAQMLGLSFFDLIAPESHQLVINLWRGRSDLSEAWTYQLTGLRRDGSTFEYRCTSVSLETPRGKATAAFFERLDVENDASESVG